jgi:hypothetical protein
MLRTRSCVIALAVMLVGIPTAQSADEILTLACKGTKTSGLTDNKPEPVSMGIIVNFTKRTVHGFGSPGVMGVPVEIIAWNDVTVEFLGSEGRKLEIALIKGTIDRVTGDVEATSMMTNTKGDTVMFVNYSLKCRPAQRMF